MTTTTVTTVRSNAETSFEYRNGLLKAAARSEWMGTTDCSAAAAVVLAVLKERCIINQIDVNELLSGCVVHGINRVEFTEAVEELEELDVLMFYVDRETGTAYAQTLDHFGRQVQIEASEAVQ